MGDEPYCCQQRHAENQWAFLLACMAIDRELDQKEQATR